MGGGNDPRNLVRLTYREHFLIHWLLTKLCVGGDLRKMQRALFAMTLKTRGERIVSGWQFEAAKLAVRDLELDPEADRIWREKFKVAQESKRLAKEAWHKQARVDREANRTVAHEMARTTRLRDATAVKQLTALFMKHDFLRDPAPRRPGRRFVPFKRGKDQSRVEQSGSSLGS